MIFVCDLDGTLADHRHRFHYVTTDKPRNYERYYQEAVNDPPILNAVEPVRRLAAAASPNFYFLTGRPEKYRLDTVNWLYKHFSIIAIPPDGTVMAWNHVRLVMRPDGDYRKAHIFKEDFSKFLYTSGADEHRAIIFIDDDLRNHEMYSKYGILMQAPYCWSVL